MSSFGLIVNGLDYHDPSNSFKQIIELISLLS